MLSPVTVLLRAPGDKKPFVSHVYKLKICSQNDCDNSVVSSEAAPDIHLASGRDTDYGEVRPRRTVCAPKRLISEC